VKGEMAMKVGTVCKLKVDCLGNKAGTLGVVFNEYDDEGGAGFQAIFENGNYDGFSTTRKTLHPGTKGTEAEYFLEEVGFEQSLAGYQFRNVMQVAADFKKGLFDIVWRSEKVEEKDKKVTLSDQQVCDVLRTISKQLGPPDMTVLLPAIKPSEMMDESKAEQVEFEPVPLAKLLHFIADMM
jgi:hypothetical protein